MKKVISMATILLLALGIFGVSAFSAESDSETVTVYVTISDEGQLVLTQVAVSVSDIDGDGVLTINDALDAAHETAYVGGASAGYGYYTGDYGLSMSKLWGDESGCFGYTLNNGSAWSLADAVKEGDHIYAYVYTDQIAWSDTYSYFDINTATVTENGEVTLTLSASGYDSNRNPVTLPVEGATITVNGEVTSCKTNAEGKVILKLDDAGTYVISAISDSSVLVPPVCTVNVEAIADTGDDALVYGCFALVMIGAIIVMTAYRKRIYEK